MFGGNTGASPFGSSSGGGLFGGAASAGTNLFGGAPSPGNGSLFGGSTGGQQHEAARVVASSVRPVPEVAACSAPLTEDW
eukprot:g2310.t1